MLKYKFSLLTSTVFLKFSYMMNAGAQLWLQHMFCKWAHCSVYSLSCDTVVFCWQYSVETLTLHTAAHSDSAQVTVLWTAKSFTTSLASLSSRLCLALVRSANSFHNQINRHSIKTSAHTLWVFNKFLLHLITRDFL